MSPHFSDQQSDFSVDIEVRDVAHLTDIMAALRATPSVTAADRARR